MRGLQVLNESVSLGALAKPGVRESIDISVSTPPWLAASGRGVLPCWEVDPELFFPLKYNLTCQDQIEEARTVCSQCPVRLLCLENAVADPELIGIWAGTTPMERRRIRTGKGRRPDWALPVNERESVA